MSDSNLNKNTAIELNVGQSGNKKVVKQKGEQNNYFEMDYREKYLELKEENLNLKEIIHKLEIKLNYNEYFFAIPTNDLQAIKFEEILNSKGVKKYTRKIVDKGWDIKYYVHKDEWMKFIECVEEYKVLKNDK
ncbi:MAG: hypothetical protein ACRC8P_00820 [Spiroplasma sp.]